MTSKSNRTLERIARRVAVPEPAYERMLRRRDHNRRSQRIGAGAVGITVFVAMVWIVTTGGPFDPPGKKGQQPGTSVAPSVTNARPVEPIPPRSAFGPLTTAPWVGVKALPEVDYVINLNTGATTPLPEAIIRSSLRRTDEGLGGPHYAVSPDGSKLAYVGTGDDGVPQIFVSGESQVRRVTHDPVRQVTHDPVGADWPDWSPDGTRIAYLGGSISSDLVSDRDLLVLDVATGVSTRVADGVAFPSGLQFTPDGSSLVYTGPSSSAVIGAEMRTVPLAGGQSTILFGGGHRGVGHAGAGSLSPDGSLVTMIGHLVNGPGAGRFVVNADGTELRSIRGYNSNPGGMWSPDGRRIVCLGPDQQHGGIIVVDVVTGDASLVAEGSEAIWLDGHTLLVSV